MRKPIKCYAGRCNLLTFLMLNIVYVFHFQNFVIAHLLIGTIGKIETASFLPEQ